VLVPNVLLKNDLAFSLWLKTFSSCPSWLKLWVSAWQQQFGKRAAFPITGSPNHQITGFPVPKRSRSKKSPLWPENIGYLHLMSSPALTLKDILALKPFRRLWLAQFVSIFGDFLALFGVISFITFRLHGTAVQVTAVTMAFVVPMAVVSPLAGVMVDRWNVKRVMIASDLVRAFLVLLLVFVQSVPQICAIFAALSTVSSFFSPAQTVTLRTLVPREGLLAANALMSQAFYTVRLASPALAGALVAWLTEKSCFYLDSASFFFSAAMLSTLAISRPIAQKKEGTLRALAADFLAGNKFIFTHSALGFVFIAMAIAMFILSSFSPLISIYIRDSLGAGPFLFGIISSMVGIGLILGSQVVNRLARNLPGQYVVLGGLLALGVGAALLGVFRYISMAAAGTFMMGVSIAFIIVPAQTLSQKETPHEMMGRVSSSLMSLISLAQALGLLVSGYLAQRLGIRQLFISCAAALGAIAVIGYLWVRERRALTTAKA
jgi:DHA3 family macrolide efflux protein-like MFS transporter